MPQIHDFEIIPRAPYSFDLTAARFGRFDSEIVDLLDGKRYRRLLAAGRQLALATVTDTGTVGRPRLAVELRSASKTPLQREAFEAQVRRILCTDLDLRPFYRMAVTTSCWRRRSGDSAACALPAARHCSRRWSAPCCRSRST